MKSLARNKQTIYYALYLGKQEKIDSNGNHTGTYELTYGTPKMLKANVSAAKGTTDVEQFGINEPYTHTIVTDDLGCEIAEDSVLWIGKTPTDGKYNFVIQRVAKGLNSIMYAVKEVKVGA